MEIEVIVFVAGQIIAVNAVIKGHFILPERAKGNTINLLGAMNKLASMLNYS